MFSGFKETRSKTLKKNPLHFRNYLNLIKSYLPKSGNKYYLSWKIQALSL